MSVAKLIARTLLDVADAVAEQVERFRRKKSKAQQKSELEAWNYNHMPRYSSPRGECAVCDKPRAQDTEHCTGAVRRWIPRDRATLHCPHVGAGLPGCEICDPRRNGGRRFQ